MAESFASDYEEAYDEMLDEMGAAALSQYSVSRMLRETDPIAYDVGMNDYEYQILAEHQDEGDDSPYENMFDDDEELTSEGQKMLKEMYDEMLDEFTIDSLLETYDASRLLKETDPIAYRVGLSDYESSMEEDDRNVYRDMAMQRKGMMNAEFSAQGKQYPMIYKPVEYYLEKTDNTHVIRSKESGTQIELSEVYKDFAAESVVRNLNSILFNQTYRYLQEITNGKSPKIPQYSLSDASRNKNNPVIKFDGNPIFELSKEYSRVNRIFAESVAKDLNRDLGNNINGLLQFITNKVGAGYIKDIGLNRAETFEAREKRIGGQTIVKNPNFPSRTSLKAYMKTSKGELRKLFGNPNFSNDTGYNLILGGKRVTIYDHRQSSKRGMKYFNIGSDDYMGPIILAQIISAHRDEKVHPKETTPRWLEDKGHHEQVKSIDEHPDLTYEKAMSYSKKRYYAETFGAESYDWAEIKEEINDGGVSVSVYFIPKKPQTHSEMRSMIKEYFGITGSFPSQSHFHFITSDGYDIIPTTENDEGIIEPVFHIRKQDNERSWGAETFGAEDTIEVSKEDMYADFKIRKWIRAMEEKGFSYIIRQDKTGVMYDEEGNKFYSQTPEFLVYEIDNIDDITNWIETDASEEDMKLFISDKHNEIYTSRYGETNRHGSRSAIYFPAKGIGLAYGAETFGAEESGCDWIQIGHGNHPTKMSYIWYCEKLNAQIDSIKKPSRNRKVKPNSFTQNWGGGNQSHYYGAEESGLTRLPSDEPNFDPQKADRNKDGKISSWERTVGNKVAKGIREGRKTSSKGIDTFAEPFEDIGISKTYARLGVIAAGITALAIGVNRIRK